MLFDRKAYFDAYLHSEYDGVFFMLPGYSHRIILETSILG
jgi:hypothetical protein